MRNSLHKSKKQSLIERNHSRSTGKTSKSQEFTKQKEDFSTNNTETRHMYTYTFIAISAKYKSFILTIFRSSGVTLHNNSKFASVSIPKIDTRLK